MFQIWCVVEFYPNLRDQAFGSCLMSIFIILLMLLSLFLWVWALIVLIRYCNILPALEQVLGVLGLITGFGPVVTLVAVYVAKGHATP